MLSCSMQLPAMMSSTGRPGTVLAPSKGRIPVFRPALQTFSCPSLQVQNVKRWPTVRARAGSADEQSDLEGTAWQESTIYPGRRFRVQEPVRSSQCVWIHLVHACLSACVLLDLLQPIKRLVVPALQPRGGPDLYVWARTALLLLICFTILALRDLMGLPSGINPYRVVCQHVATPQHGALPCTVCRKGILVCVPLSSLPGSDTRG